ncbi:MAG: hypothetical protein GY913_33780 [Proteobacteria bacterium]|nr:hypothetical protein [Pseudomonadota bacterium]
MIWLLACTAKDTPPPDSPTDSPADSAIDSGYELPEECLAASERADAAELFADLDAAVASEVRWAGWRMRASHVATFVDADTGTCLGVWHDSGALWLHVTDEPALLTPIFGYYLGTQDATREEWAALFEATVQPDGVVEALQSIGVDRAVLLPLEPQGMDLDRETRFYLATHEAFHVHVQSPTWQGLPGPTWPEWDTPPDRSSIDGACYDGVGAERSALNAAVEQVLAGGEVCTDLRDFLSRREARWTGLEGTLVGDLSCPEAERRMEVEEGIPDWWALQLALDAGVLDTDGVQSQLAAVTSDAFYKTGAGQTFVLEQLLGEDFADLPDALSEADASLTSRVQAAYDASCD